jgi:hypothetical protein
MLLFLSLTEESGESSSLSQSNVMDQDSQFQNYCTPVEIGVSPRARANHMPILCLVCPFYCLPGEAVKPANPKCVP